MKNVLRVREAAEYLGLSKATLDKMRHFKTGPPYVRLGKRSVGYLVTSLDEYLRTREIHPNGEKKP